MPSTSLYSTPSSSNNVIVIVLSFQDRNIARSIYFATLQSSRSQNSDTLQCCDVNFYALKFQYQLLLQRSAFILSSFFAVSSVLFDIPSCAASSIISVLKIFCVFVPVPLKTALPSQACLLFGTIPPNTSSAVIS